MTVAFNPKDWRALPPMSLTDLWLIPKSGHWLPFPLVYEAIHGGFVPEIPYFLLARFTKPGWTVYDPFAGAMTTARVAKAMDRKCISVDIYDHGEDADPRDPFYKDLVLADARIYRPEEPVDIVLAHPPYESIIQFTNDPDDLSSMSPGEFWVAMEECLFRFDEVLKPDRMCAIVIGNIYRDSHVIPLPFMMHEMVSKTNPEWKLKAWIEKDIQGNRQNEINLWAARAASGDFCVFSHETILVYHKPKEGS